MKTVSSSMTCTFLHTATNHRGWGNYESREIMSKPEYDFVGLTLKTKHHHVNIHTFLLYMEYSRLMYVPLFSLSESFTPIPISVYSVGRVWGHSTGSGKYGAHLSWKRHVNIIIIFFWIGNGASATLSQNLIGCSTLSQEYCKLIGSYWKIMRRQHWNKTCPGRCSSLEIIFLYETGYHKH